MLLLEDPQFQVSRDILNRVVGTKFYRFAVGRQDDDLLSIRVFEAQSRHNRKSPDRGQGGRPPVGRIIGLLGGEVVCWIAARTAFAPCSGKANLRFFVGLNTKSPGRPLAHLWEKLQTNIDAAQQAYRKAINDVVTGVQRSILVICFVCIVIEPDLSSKMKKSSWNAPPLGTAQLSFFSTGGRLPRPPFPRRVAEVRQSRHSNPSGRPDPFPASPAPASFSPAPPSPPDEALPPPRLGPSETKPPSLSRAGGERDAHQPGDGPNAQNRRVGLAQTGTK